ncbi:MAG: ABC-F type ribosomal protection protein [Sporomusaceae bacterium]|nr:ABC-F type ribosomal protection protein [Sporomusaceae bacterium]
MLLELSDIVKYVNDRRLLKIDNLKINRGDKIGVVGRNGVGKSTLLAILAGEVQPDEGHVRRNCPYSSISQLGAPMSGRTLDPLAAGEFAVAKAYAGHMSGGEQTRFKIAAALSEQAPLLLADEPAANLDIKGRELLQAKLQAFQGTLVLVSHDRLLLDAVCDTIWEIDNGGLQAYRGNYTAYLAQKDNARKHREREYEKYTDKRNQLQTAIADRKARAAATRKTPARMGNSEARLHKMGNQKAKANLDKAVKAMEARLEKLPVAEKPQTGPAITFPFGYTGGLHSKIAVRGEGLDKRFGSRVIFDKADFSLPAGQKVALCGNNGSGKSTLLNMIVGRDARISLAPQARIGYFAQSMENLDPAKTLLANVMAASVHDEGAVRSLLARLLFRREDVFKPAGVLSGGERTRVSLAKIIVSDANFLLLDEPTNYLDLSSLAALEEVLADYAGTLLFVSHDRRFIDRVATRLLFVDAGKLRPFAGNYRQYLDRQQAPLPGAAKESDIVREHRRAEILARLSVTRDKDEAARLDKEYRGLMATTKA